MFQIQLLLYYCWCKIMKPKKIESFECYLCHTELKSKLSNLRRHMKLHGPEIKSFQCTKCSKRYQTKSNLLVHWNSKHRSPQEQPKFDFKTEFHSYKRKLFIVDVNAYHCCLRFLLFMLAFCCCYYCCSIARSSVHFVV